MTWATIVLAVLVTVLLWRELARRRAGSPNGARPLDATAGEPPHPFTACPDPPRRADALIPGRADAVPYSTPSLRPARLHRHESVVGGAAAGSATTVFVVRVEVSGSSARADSPLAVAMLAGSRLVAAAGASGRVTHLREGMFLVTVEGVTPEQTATQAEAMRKAVVGTPLVTSKGDLLPVTCSVSFARFCAGDPALSTSSLDELVERTETDGEEGRAMRKGGAE